jgi:hypothetical protein
MCQPKDDGCVPTPNGREQNSKVGCRACPKERKGGMPTPTKIAQERIERCQLILDTVPREHVEILEQRGDNKKAASDDCVKSPYAQYQTVDLRTLNLLSTLSTSSPSAGVQLGGGLLTMPPPGAVPPSPVEPRATFQSASSAEETCV